MEVGQIFDWMNDVGIIRKYSDGILYGDGRPFRGFLVLIPDELPESDKVVNGLVKPDYFSHEGLSVSSSRPQVSNQAITASLLTCFSSVLYMSQRSMVSCRLFRPLFFFHVLLDRFFHEIMRRALFCLGEPLQALLGFRIEFHRYWADTHSAPPWGITW